MIQIVGLIFLGLWAAVKAKQKGRNQYLWSLVPIGIYLIIYLVAYFVLDFVFGITLSFTGKYALTLALFIKIGLIPISFILSKFLLEGIFNRMPGNNEKEKLE